jgi:hypothetical protein
VRRVAHRRQLEARSIGRLDEVEEEEHGAQMGIGLERRERQPF